MVEPEPPLWHVTLTVGGSPVDVDHLRSGLDRLAAERPFLGSARYSAERIELRYWDEAVDAAEATALALRMWSEHQPTFGLPTWRVVGLEVLESSTVQDRADRRSAAVPLRPSLSALGDVRPF